MFNMLCWWFTWTILIYYLDGNTFAQDTSVYQDRLSLNGVFGQNGLSMFLSQGSSNYDPNQYFTLQSVNGQGIYIRRTTTNFLDRDVSFVCLRQYFPL